MAKFQFEGIDKYISQLEKLEKNTEEIIGAAIYEGAAVVMKEVVGAIEGLSTDNRFGTAENPTSGPNSYQKEGLRQSVGIAPMRNDGGFRNVKIGFDGYNGLHTKTWPSGQPNAMVARAVESGTSFMRKQPFMRKAEQTAKSKCERAMEQAIDKAIAKTMEGGGAGNVGSGGSSGGSGGGGSMSTGGSRGLRKYKSSSSKSSSSSRKTSTGKKSSVSVKKLASKYKKYERNIDKLVNGKTGNTKGSLKKYAKKAVTKKRGRK